MWWALGHWGGCASDAPLPIAVKYGEPPCDLIGARVDFEIACRYHRPGRPEAASLPSAQVTSRHRAELLFGYGRSAR